MADKVRSDYEELARIASAFRQEAEKSKQMLQNIRSNVDVLRNGDWVGKGASAFYQEMDGAVVPTLTRLVRALESADQTTTRILQVMRQAEDDAARVLRGEGAGGEEGGTGAGGAGAGGAGAGAGGAGRGRSVDDLKAEIRKTIEGWGTDEAKLMDLIKNATQAERDAIWNDKKLMAEIRDDLSTDEYLDVLVGLRVFEPGSTAEDGKTHTKAADADADIQKQLKDYVGNAVKDGKQISGSVAVVGDTEWDIAGKAHYGEDVWNAGKKDDINGFVDDKGRVWIHKDRGNAGTMIHEAVHKYSKDDMINASQPLNEGVTEYFARKTIDDAGLGITRGNYEENYDTTKALVDFVGEDKVAKAFFDGDMAGLKKAFLDKGKTESDWNDFIKHTKNKDWAAAETILK